MNYFMVSYDLRAPGQKYDDLIEAIQESPTVDWVKPLLSCFLIETRETAEEVYTRLKSVIDENDRLLVMKVCQPHQGWFNKDVHKWIEDNVPYCS